MRSELDRIAAALELIAVILVNRRQLREEDFDLGELADTLEDLRLRDWIKQPGDA